MSFNTKKIAMFFIASFLIITSCSKEGLDSQRSMAASQEYQAAIADSRRPAEEVARDVGRKPAQVLDFFGVSPGQRVVDISAGDGYFTRIISGIVGSEGSVVAQNSGRRASDEFKAIYEEQYSTYDNVELNFELPEEMSLPDNSVDMALLSLSVHHWHYSEDSGEFVPLLALGRYDNIFRMLKSGGVFAVIEHETTEGMSRSESNSIHRIPRDIAIADITMAGFVFERESDIHANNSDDISVRWTREPRDATKRIVHLYRKQ